MNSIKSKILNLDRKIVTEVKNDTVTVEDFIASRSKDDVTYYNYSILAQIYYMTMKMNLMTKLLSLNLKM